MIDYHIHTNYSDGRNTIEEYLEAAERIRLKEIAFTDHLFFSPHRIFKGRKISIEPEEIENYVREIRDARERYSVKAKIGLEVDYLAGREGEARGIVDKHPFDFILGTPHVLEGHLITIREELLKFMGEKSMAEAYEMYFSEVKGAVESGIFDVIAHPDVIRSMCRSLYHRELPFERYKDLVEKVAELMVERGVGIEANAGLPFLKACREEGVRVVTVGSDAHDTSRLASGVNLSTERLREAGFGEICLFSRRKPKFIRLFR